MYRIDSAGSTGTMPTRGSPSGIGGYFTGGDPTTATPATVIEADFLNAIMNEICNVITAAGLTLNKATDNQLLAALNAMYVRAGGSSFLTYSGDPNGHVAGTQAGPVTFPTLCWDYLNRRMWVCVVTGIAANAQWVTLGGGTNYAVDTGGTNSIVAAPPIPIATYGGMPLAGSECWVEPIATNTGPTVANISSTGAYPVVGGNDTALQGGEIVQARAVRLMFNRNSGGFWSIVSGAAGTRQGKDPVASHHFATKGYVDAAQARGFAAFTTPGAWSWTVPAGVTSALFELIGPGGGSGGCGTGDEAVSGAGGGGALAMGVLTVTPTGTVSGIIGQGGVGGSAGGGNGAAGTATTITVGGSASAGSGQGGNGAVGNTVGASGAGGTVSAPGGWLALAGVAGVTKSTSSLQAVISLGGYTPMRGAYNTFGGYEEDTFAPLGGASPGQGASGAIGGNNAGAAGGNGIVIIRW